MNADRKAYLELHTAVLLFGFTAILGDLILLPALELVWWRVLLTCVSLLFFIRFGKNLHEIPSALIWQYMGIGILVGLHWICFFAAIKYSNASITLVCLATASFFTSLLEPLLLRQKWKWYEIGIGLFIIPGMILIVHHTELSMMTGIWIGLLAALLQALFGTLNKKLVHGASSMSITFLELGSAWFFISLVFPLYYLYKGEFELLPSMTDLGYLLILSLLCTTLAYVLALRSLRQLSAFAASLAVNLEPIYGILLAWLILHEEKELNNGFYLGAAVIILAVFSYPFFKKNWNDPVL